MVALYLGSTASRLTIFRFQSESKKYKDPGNQDPRKVWESEEGLPKYSRVISQFEINEASLNKSINNKWLSEENRRILYLPYREY
jgi:hypothetical protein